MLNAADALVVRRISLAAMFTQRFLSLLTLAILLLYSRFTECECDSTHYFIAHSTNVKCLSQFCLTFQQFEANASNLLKSDTVLTFSSGIHSSPTNGLTIANKERFSSDSKSMDTVIICNDSEVFQFNSVKMVTIVNLTFKECGKVYPGAITIFSSAIQINNCTFINSKGTIIVINSGKVLMTKSIFMFSDGAALHATNNSTICITDCVYEWNNSSQTSLLYIYSSNISFKNCLFHNNSAKGSSRMLYTRNSILELKQCQLVSNRAVTNLIHLANCMVNINETTFKHNTIKKGMILLEDSISNISSSILVNNKALNSGVLCIYKGEAKIYNGIIFRSNSVIRYGVMYMYHSKVLMMEHSKSRSKLQRQIIIQENKARWGVLYILQSVVLIQQKVLIQRNSAVWNAVDFRKSIIKINETFHFLHNNGCILIEESLIDFIQFSNFCNNKQRKQCYNTKKYKLGGAITSIWSTVQFKFTARFLGNKSLKGGGAILVTESRLYTNSRISFSYNFAKDGGALYLDSSTFICIEMCAFIGNRALSKGGAIHAINSVIHIGYEWQTLPQVMNTSTTILFINNTANCSGGGISFEANSKFQGPLQPKHNNYNVTFNTNAAGKGEAIYVNDDTNTGTCKGKEYSTCFFNIPYLFSSESRFKISNSGRFTLYGGLLDRCTQRATLGDILNYKTFKMTGIDYLRFISKDPNIQQMITSDPVQICFCEGEAYNCTINNKMYKTINGETFNVQITAVDQVQRPVRAKIYVEHESTGIRLGLGQQVKAIEDRCSNLTLAIYAPNVCKSIPTNLTIYADGPCGRIGISLKTILVNILPCQCPIGFQLLNKSEGCSCDCSSELKPYKTMCNQTNQSLIRQDDFWINYTNDSGTIHLIIYSHCPYDYCAPSTSNVSVNLNLPDGIDAQCADGRTGLLCSSCKPDLSLSLGSTLCLACSSVWPKMLSILLGAITAGIALVMVIFTLNLSVANGTLNGLIFYANIVALNYCRLPKSNFFSVFISWLNLELGLNTCFYKGMDAYSKAWLQFAFPTYLIAVLVMVIIVSKYSSRFVKLIGKRNPVATLATLILLS